MDIKKKKKKEKKRKEKSSTAQMEAATQYHNSPTTSFLITSVEAERVFSFLRPRNAPAVSYKKKKKKKKQLSISETFMLRSDISETFLWNYSFSHNGFFNQEKILFHNPICSCCLVLSFFIFHAIPVGVKICYLI